MIPLSSILVDIDAMAHSQPALERAARVARAVGARLRIVDTLCDQTGVQSGFDCDVEDESVRRRQDRLERLADGLPDIPIATELLDGWPAKALIHDVVRFNHDLVVRSHARNLVDDQRTQFGDIDLELIRNCPCAVWALGHGSLSPKPRVVAAVDASAEEPLRRHLTATVIEWAIVLAFILSGTATLLHVWHPFAEKRARYYGTNTEFSAYQSRAQLRAQRRLSSLAKRYRLKDEHLPIELRRGRVERVIPEFVVSEGVDIVVLGSPGRRGFVQRLMRGTAERLIQTLPCSVVVVKPVGSVSHGRLRRPA